MNNVFKKSSFEFNCEAATTEWVAIEELNPRKAMRNLKYKINNGGFKLATGLTGRKVTLK
jgi:hypothetical protein